MKRFLSLLFLAIIFIQCDVNDKPSVAFYYWKTHFKLSENNTHFTQQITALIKKSVILKP